MRKFLFAGVIAGLVVAANAGTASAACPPPGPAPYSPSGTVVSGEPVGSAWVDASNPTSPRAGGDVNNGNLGYGQANPSVSGSGISYSGTLSSGSGDSALGYGDVQGSTGTGGVNGSADGQTAGGAGQASGTLSVPGSGLTITCLSP
jgi:hypothetical protein